VPSKNCRYIYVSRGVPTSQLEESDRETVLDRVSLLVMAVETAMEKLALPSKHSLRASPLSVRQPVTMHASA
jgi:hypothetical protein